MSRTPLITGENALVSKQCSACGAEFGCGIEQASCWCSELPALESDRLLPAKDCLCPDCLRAALENREHDSA